MASFIAKQLIGNQLDSVKGAVGDKEEKAEGGKERDPELEEALREQEEKRQEKHRKQEEERETMRQGIRDKYGIKKKEDEMDMMGLGGNAPEGRLGRSRKTPQQLAAEQQAAEEEEDSIINMLPENMRGPARSAIETPQRLVTEAQEKCSLM